MSTTPGRTHRADVAPGHCNAEVRGGWLRWFLPDSGRAEALDGLRGVAVLIVVLSHFSNNGLLPGPGLSGAGKSGVYLFFVLSAFLLTAALLRRDPSELRNASLWIDYALRRVLRIWPLYLVVLIASWWATRTGWAWWRYQIDTPALWRHLTLREGVSVLWSIPVEFTFYFWLPPLALIVIWLRGRHAWLWLQAVIFALLVGGAALLWPPAESLPNDVRLGPYAAVFLCGVFAAALDLGIRGRPNRAALWAAVGLVALLASLLGMPAVWSKVTATAFDAGTGQQAFVFWGLVWAGLLLAVLHGPAWLRAPFAWAPLRWVGAISFSLYLWHLPVLGGLRASGLVQPGEPWAAMWALIAALAVSALSYLALERPWQGVRYGGIHRRPL
ncbi:acyltransferase [Luteimonas sp. 100069]|uniref:acyltransferase family protein n=1 Tax=Luteimonas sp. 100069 TaxID=2006109 RepID=UPI000F4FE406|nr:acyltransferase [Luteimonas sp. 100069]RPD87773.1 acyltransferase [Luteimonas sp. 100069]